MFNKLIASKGGRGAAASGKAMTISIVVHGLMLAGAVYASTRPPTAEDPEEEQVTFLDVVEPAVESEPPPPEPPPSAPLLEAPPPVRGFQELIPPLNPPPVIPDVALDGPAVDPRDFLGDGLAGGTAEGRSDGEPTNLAETEPQQASEPGFAYQLAVLDSPPALSNTSDVQRALSRQYPRLLLEAGISGTVVMRFIIEADGTVDESSLQVVSASNDQFRSAAANVVGVMRFRAGRYRGDPVRVLTEMPINFRAE